MIGIQYICTTFIFFFIGGAMAMIMRAELAQPGTQIVEPGTFNSLFSAHAAIMIFVFVIPVFAGIANYVLPLMIGAPDMAFPRLNALSFWMLPIAGLMFVGSFLCPGGAFDAGWTGYAPLSTGAPLGQSFFNLGVQFAGASSIATALNFLVTIITMRAPGMNFWRMPLLVWANMSTSLLVVAATPFIAGVQFMVLFDRALHTNFFQTLNGGDVLSYGKPGWDEHRRRRSPERDGGAGHQGHRRHCGIRPMRSRRGIAWPPLPLSGRRCCSRTVFSMIEIDGRRLAVAGMALIALVTLTATHRSGGRSCPWSRAGPSGSAPSTSWACSG